MHVNTQKIVQEFERKHPKERLFGYAILIEHMASEIAEAREIMLQICRAPDLSTAVTLAAVFLQVNAE